MHGWWSTERRSGSLKDGALRGWCMWDVMFGAERAAISEIPSVPMMLP